MRKGLLIIVGLCITACFLSYILDFKPQAETVFPDITDDIPQATDSDKTLPVGGSNPNVTPPVLISPSQSADMQNTDGLSLGCNDWELVWSDEFDGPYLDLESWTEVSRKDNYNNELQYYTPANSYIQDGCLFLTAKAEAREGKTYTSAMVQTMNKYAFRFGRIEARIKMPVGKGIFPAFWLMAYEGESEVDVVEMIGSEPNLFYGVVFYMEDGKLQKDADMIKNESPEEFHVYALEWEPDELRWYIDDELFFRTDQGVPTREMYIIFTLAVGGDWPGSPSKSTVFPCSMAIDSVKIYKHQQ